MSAIGRCCRRLAFRSVVKVWQTEVRCPAEGRLSGRALAPPVPRDTDETDTTRALACARVRTTEEP